MKCSPLLAREDDPRALLADPAYCVEEFLSGRRLLISKHGIVVRAFSRERVVSVLPLPVIRLASSFPGDFVLDGELVGESFVAFDLLDGCGVNVCGEQFALRRRLLALLSPFPVVVHATGEADKTRLFECVRAACGAGVVFNRLDASYDLGDDIYGVRFNNYRMGVLNVGDVSIEKCSAGSSHVRKPRRPRTLWPQRSVGEHFRVPETLSAAA